MGTTGFLPFAEATMSNISELFECRRKERDLSVRDVTEMHRKQRSAEVSTTATMSFLILPYSARAHASGEGSPCCKV